MLQISRYSQDSKSPTFPGRFKDDPVRQTAELVANRRTAYYGGHMKLTFACPATLKADLDRYAALYAQTYGRAVDVATLTPHMLEAFMAGDRGFRKRTLA